MLKLFINLLRANKDPYQRIILLAKPLQKVFELKRQIE